MFEVKWVWDDFSVNTDFTLGLKLVFFGNYNIKMMVLTLTIKISNRNLMKRIAMMYFQIII